MSSVTIVEVVWNVSLVWDLNLSQRVHFSRTSDNVIYEATFKKDENSNNDEKLYKAHSINKENFLDWRGIYYV